MNEHTREFIEANRDKHKPDSLMGRLYDIYDRLKDTASTSDNIRIYYDDVDIIAEVVWWILMVEEIFEAYNKLDDNPAVGNVYRRNNTKLLEFLTTESKGERK